MGVHKAEEKDSSNVKRRGEKKEQGMELRHTGGGLSEIAGCVL